MAADTEPRVKRATCWMDEDVIRMAKVVASHEGVNTSDVLERNAKPGVLADYKRAVAEMAKEHPTPAKG